MNFSQFVEALGSPVALAFVGVFFFSALISLVVERSFLDSGRFKAVVFSFLGFLPLFIVLLIIVEGITVGALQDQGRDRAEIVGLMGLAVILKTWWIFLLIELGLLSGRAYLYKK